LSEGSHFTGPKLELLFAQSTNSIESKSSFKKSPKKGERWRRSQQSAFALLAMIGNDVLRTDEHARTLK
jgi:hypothetical protein